MKLFLTLFMVIGLISVSSFQAEKKLKLELTESQASIVYKALGKLPAEEVEQIRSYISYEYTKQFTDTTTKKK